MDQYDTLRAQAVGGWNKTHFLGVLNYFLVHHREMSERFPEDYGKFEKSLVEAAYAGVKQGRPLLPTMERDFSKLDATERKAACWKELMDSYCRVHGTLRVERRAWSDNEYRDFLATIEKLRNALVMTNSHG